MNPFLERLARPEILALRAYDVPRRTPETIALDANEFPWSPFGEETLATLNRYPDHPAPELLGRLSELYGVARTSLLPTRGSSEAIDLLCRAFCRPGRDEIIVTSPTFEVYALAARLQGAGVIDVPLQRERGFAVDPGAIIDRCLTTSTKIVFLCTPNNPTGNLLDEEALVSILEALAERCLVVIDEAYIEFSGRPSFSARRERYPHLVVLRTLSKAHGLAGVRLGCLLAEPTVIDLLRRVMLPYVIARPVVEVTLRALTPEILETMNKRRACLLRERTRLAEALKIRTGVRRVWPSEANFLLVEFDDVETAWERAQRQGIAVRRLTSHPGLDKALRVSVGTPEENDRLLEAWS